MARASVYPARPGPGIGYPSRPDAPHKARMAPGETSPPHRPQPSGTALRRSACKELGVREGVWERGSERKTARGRDIKGELGQDKSKARDAATGTRARGRARDGERQSEG